MKTVIKLLAAMLLAVISLHAQAADYDFESEGLYYNILSESDHTVEVKYQPYGSPDISGDIVIPNEVIYNSQTYTVTSIRAWAFYGCSSLTSVTIPNSVTSIGASAFNGCSNLESVNVDLGNIVYTSIDGVVYDKNLSTLLLCPEGKVSVTIPSSVISIGESAFFRCSSLKSVSIPNSVTSIGKGAFSACSSLKSVAIPNSVTSIGKSAFSACSSLKSVAIPNSVTSIGEWAFVGCIELESINVDLENTVYTSIDGVLYNKDVSTLLCCPGGKSSITIPNSVTSIGGYAFSNCSSLTSVTIPFSVTSIGEYAFSNCSSLTYVTIPESVTSIGEYAFASTSLTSVTIPESLTSIGERVFYDCSNLTSVTIPESVTSIGRGAFTSCTSLTSVAIPTSVTSIGDSAFYSCSSLTSVTIPNSVISIGWGAFDGCTSLTSVIIPESVTSIEEHVFCNCTSLTSVTVPNSVTSIGMDAFGGCTSLTSITIPNSVTSIGELVFCNCYSLKIIYMQCEEPIVCNPGFSDGNYKETILYVPTGTLSAYESVDPWRNFQNIKEMDFSGVDEIETDSKEELQISVENGSITVDGNHETVTVYNIQGRIIYSGTSHVIDNLAPGLYILKAGNQTAKVSI